MLGLLVVLLMFGGALISGYMLYLLQSSGVEHPHKAVHHAVHLEPHRYNFKI